MKHKDSQRTVFRILKLLNKATSKFLSALNGMFQNFLTFIRNHLLIPKFWFWFRILTDWKFHLRLIFKNANFYACHAIALIKPRIFSGDFVFHMLAIVNQNVVKFIRLNFVIVQLFYQNDNLAVVSLQNFQILQIMRKYPLTAKIHE